MNIFAIPETDPKLKEIIRCIEYRQRSVESVVSAYEVSFKDFWNNKTVTPQEHCDYFGTSAADFFLINSKVLAFINELNPNYAAPVIPNEFSINPDGTVTVTPIPELAPVSPYTAPAT